MSKFTRTNLVSSRLLARNTLINFTGQVAPLLIALFAIPLIIRDLGADRFGVLTLAWVLIGYFTVFDFGLGRVVTKLVAEKLGTEYEREISTAVWTALSLMLLLGLVGTAFLSLLAPLLVQDLLKIPEALRSETLRTFYLLALSLPIITSTAGLRGILEAQQRFGLINAVRVPTSAFTFLGPLLVLPFSQSLVPVVAVLVASKVLAWLVYVLLCFRTMPALRSKISLQRTAIRPLLRLGGWITVSNVLGPLMDYIDRFAVGVLISATAVAYYATPHEMVTKLLIIPIGIASVMFPAFASSLAQNRGHAALLFGASVKYAFLILFPLVLLIVTLAYEGLDLWLGSEFAQNSTLVLQLLAVGILANSLAQMPFGLVQSAGRPDLTAKLHFVELPIYLLTLWGLLGTFGIEGAAVAWVFRAAVDALLLFVIAHRLLPTITVSFRRTAAIVIAVLLTLVLAAFPASLVVKGFFLSLTLLTFALCAWFLILTPTERALVQERLKLSASNSGGKL
jgi:O-antigen/teichoic acid export membrane protein